jgi:hypothetical protein
MRSTSVIALGALVLVGGCGGPQPTQHTPGLTHSPTDAATPTSPATSSMTPEASPSSAVSVPEPGRPWDAGALLREMAASTRPDGVPAELQTQPVAEAVADAIWTIDGGAWDTFAIGGFCGSASCALEVAGTRLGYAGEDLWVLEVDPATATVDVTDATLRSLPPQLVGNLDALARDLVHELPANATLMSSLWLPPPEVPGRFELSYRTGGEEGSCAIDLVLDVVNRRVVDETSTGC